MVIPHHLHAFRDLYPCGGERLQRRHRQCVGGRRQAVKGYAPLRQRRQLVRHAVQQRFPGEALQAGQNQLLPGFHAPLGMGLPVALQLALPGIAQGVAQVQHLPAARIQQHAHRPAGGVPVVGEQAVHPRRVQGADEQHHGHFLRRPKDVAVVLRPLLHKVGAAQDHGVHPLVEHQLHVLLAHLQVILGAQEHAVIPRLAQKALQEKHGPGNGRVGHVGAQQAHGFHGVQPQAPGEDVGGISAFLHHRQHPLPGFGAHQVAAVEHPGHRGDGHPRPLGYIVNGQRQGPLLLSRKVSPSRRLRQRTCL